MNAAPVQSQSMQPMQPMQPMLPDVYRIQRVRRELADTFTLDLAREDGRDTAPFAAGQFNMLYVFGVGEIPISISGDPGRPGPLVHTTRAVGTVSQAMRALKLGDALGVRGPYGTGWPLEQAKSKDIVLVAGGIGLAPLRPAMYEILAHRDQYGKVALLYGARTPADILYRRELEHWRAHFDLDVSVTVDRATGDWRGSVGVVTRLIPRAPCVPSNTIALVCGPEIMMRFSAAELLTRGIAPEAIFVSMERNMKCAIGLCGHCQYQPYFVCKDGPVFPYARVQGLLSTWEL